MSNRSALKTFDGLDNRKNIMEMLFRLGTDAARKKFIESLIPHSETCFADKPMKVTGNCDPSAAYFMMVSICNELGVNINVAAAKLEKVVRKL